jgi:hypothetical protein
MPDRQGVAGSQIDRLTTTEDVNANPAPFARPKSSNALRFVARHSAMPLSVAPIHHMGVMFTGIATPVVGGVCR